MRSQRDGVDDRIRLHMTDERGDEARSRADACVVGGGPAGEFHFKTIAPAYPYAIWMPQPVFLDALVKKASGLPGSRAG